MPVKPVLATALAAALTLAAAGCGGGTGAPGVASLGPAGGASSPMTASHTASAGGHPAVFAACLGRHGFHAVVVSDVNGASNLGDALRLPGIAITGGVDPQSPQLQAALRACRKYQPGGEPPPLTPAVQAEMRQALTAFAACMRRHGVPGFPDPQADGLFAPGQLQRLGLTSPQMRSGAHTCQPLLPTVGVRLRLPGMT
jgi:hypothetical protein